MTEEENTRRELVESARQPGPDTPRMDPSDSLLAVRVKLYYVFSSKRADLWEDFQRRVAAKSEDEMVAKWAHKPIAGITTDEQHEIALEAFHAAIQGRDQPVMADIVRSSQIDLQTRDLVELIDKDYYSVIKAIVQKPLPVSKQVKRDFQCPKYHRAERVMNILGVETRDQYLELGDIVDYMLDNSMPDSKLEKFLMFFSDSKDKSSLRSLLIHEKEKIAERFYREGNICSSDLIMLVALEYKEFDFLLLYMKANNYELSDESMATPLFSKLVKLFLSDLPHAELYLYIMRRYSDLMPYSAAKEFVVAINDWVQSQKLRIPFIYAVVNPVKICVLLIEMLCKIKKDNDSLEKWIENIIADLTRLGELLISEVHDDSELNEIFMDRDLDGRPMIEIAGAYEVLALFKHKSITTVTEKFWSGPYISNQLPFDGNSMLLGNLLHNPTSRIDLFYRSLSKLVGRDYMAYPTHNFQYVTWRDGLQSRYIFESLFYIALFIYTYYLTAASTYYGRAAYTIINQRKNDNVTPTLQDVTDIGQNFSSMVDILRQAQCYLLSLFIVNFRHIFLGAFALLTGRPMKAMYTEIMLDALLNFCIALYYFYVYSDFDDVLNYRSNIRIFNTHMTTFWDGNGWIVPLYSIILVLIFLRSLNLLEVHTVIGPFIEMIKQMFFRLGTFSLLFAILLFFFAMVASIYLPYSIVEHRALYRSLVTLFQTSIGVFDINLMNSEMKAEIFTFIYVIVFNILLLNLLIAILTQVYTTISDEADTLYVNDIVVLQALYSPHEEYSSIIDAFPPLNFVFGFICLPTLLLTPAPKREAVNAFFLKIEYTLALILVLGVYLACELFFLALCYVKVTLHEFVLILIGWEWGTSMRIVHFVLFLVLGPVLLLAMLVSDVYYFALHAYRGPGERRFTDETREPMHKRVLLKLYRFVTDIKEKYAIIPWESLRKSLYDLCSIDIFSHHGATRVGEEPVSVGIGLNHKHTRSKYRNYKNFTIASQILKLNATIEDEEIMVDIETLSMILENYIFVARMQKRQSILIKKEISEIMRKRSSGCATDQTVNAQPVSNNNSMQVDKSGAALISMRAENAEPDTEEQHVLMKLCLSYSIEKYTNALIAFKDKTSLHWLAKNSLLMAQDVRTVKKSLLAKQALTQTQLLGKPPLPPGVVPSEEKKKRSEPASRDDSLNMTGSLLVQQHDSAPTSTKGGDGKNANLSFTVQELDDILKGVESESPMNESRRETKLVPPQMGSAEGLNSSPRSSKAVGKSPASKSLFAGDPEIKFS